MSDHQIPSPVLLCSTTPPTVCGIGDYTAHLAGAFRERGIAPEIWSHATVGIAAGEQWGAEALRTLAAKLKENRPSLLHLQYETGLYGHSAALPFVVARAVHHAGIPLVTTFHALDGPPSWGRAHRVALLPLLIASRDITVCSERQRRSLARLLGVAGKTHHVPIGSNVPVAGDRYDPMRMRTGAPLRLVYFGFVWRGKQIEIAVRALAAVCRETPPCGATLTVIGVIRDQGYLDEIKALAATLGVAERLTFTGEMLAVDISRTLSRADLALLPYPTGASTGRGTLMTALAHHLPVVTTVLPANLSADFVDGENLLFAPVGEEQAFIQQAVRLAGDPNLRAHLSKGAARLAERFTWSTIADRILALPSYQGLVRAR